MNRCISFSISPPEVHELSLVPEESLKDIWFTREEYMGMKQRDYIISRLMNEEVDCDQTEDCIWGMEFRPRRMYAISQVLEAQKYGRGIPGHAYSAAAQASAREACARAANYRTMLLRDAEESFSKENETPLHEQLTRLLQQPKAISKDATPTAPVRLLSPRKPMRNAARIQPMLRRVTPPAHIGRAATA